MALGVLVFGGSWLLILTLLALDLAGVLHRGAPFRWQATGLLIIDSAVGISASTWDGAATGAGQRTPAASWRFTPGRTLSPGTPA
jgi:hypothetical protein